MEGLARKEEGDDLKDEILGAILDLRSIRQTRRGVDKVLTKDQRARLESFRKESEAKEQNEEKTGP